MIKAAYAALLLAAGLSVGWAVTSTTWYSILLAALASAVAAGAFLLTRIFNVQ